MNRETKLQSNRPGIGREEARQNRRKEALISGCKAMMMPPSFRLYNHLNPKQVSTLDHFIVMEELKLFYCCIPHAGCNTLKKIWGLHDGRIHQEHDDGVENRRTPRLLSQYKTEKVKSILQEYSSFIFTRNPYYRLLSAFLTIFEQKGQLSEIDESVKEIRRIFTSKIKQEKRHSAKDDHSNYSVSFPDFVDHVSSSTNRLLGKGEDRWREIYRLCHLCGVDYGFLGKYETFQEDIKIITRRYGLDINVTKVQLDDSPLDIDVMKRYLQEITPSQISKFSKRYVADTSLFGYTIPKSL
ncbi:carbohydrate sulfotransferase 14-like [Lytechinus variegatus]|uniref:carbohydrate sulfotransferase 14-like n=1 Tax=Lytechinus variegatus TaxID=7654 RepID=UPI001BB1D241|nr:carbohydrate sulfotransferase 14-like [Lytechinus variegatus]